MKKENKPRCPKCDSDRITIYIDEDRKSFKCSKCDHKWSQMKIIKKDVQRG